MKKSDNIRRLFVASILAIGLFALFRQYTTHPSQPERSPAPPYQAPTSSIPVTNLSTLSPSPSLSPSTPQEIPDNAALAFNHTQDWLGLVGSPSISADARGGVSFSINDFSIEPAEPTKTGQAVQLVFGDLKRIEANVLDISPSGQSISLSIGGLDYPARAHLQMGTDKRPLLARIVAPQQALAYTVRTNEKGTFEVQAIPLRDLLPDDSGLVVAPEDGTGDSNSPVVSDDNATRSTLDSLTTAAFQILPLAETFMLHSRPEASRKIFLDFDGQTTTGTDWNTFSNGGNPIVTPAYSFEGDASFSDNELTRIQYIWQRVAEDFAPFDVDVTTEDPGAEGLSRSNASDLNYGIRVLIGGSYTDWYKSSAGGVAYLRSFVDPIDTPAFVFENNLGDGNEKYTAEACSHEAGHTLGLHHDGTSTVGYYQGHGSGATGWAPIMGVGYNKSLTQWSKGEYTDANNKEDDLNLITTLNGFGYRSDLAGDTRGAAAPIRQTSPGTIAQEGIIEKTADIDVYSFHAEAGPCSISIVPDARSPNLDILATLYDSAGTVIASDNGLATLSASISTTLNAGDYFIAIEGIGNPPPDTGYSDYASLGQYTISGTFSASLALPPQAPSSIRNVE